MKSAFFVQVVGRDVLPLKEGRPFPEAYRSDALGGDRRKSVLQRVRWSLGRVPIPNWVGLQFLVDPTLQGWFTFLLFSPNAVGPNARRNGPGAPL